MIGFVNSAEMDAGVFTIADVWMILQRELPEGLFDLHLRRTRLDSEGFILLC